MKHLPKNHHERMRQVLLSFDGLSIGDGFGECFFTSSDTIPRTETYHQLLKALEVPFDTEPKVAAGVLGNGSRVISSDTVPFCLWCAARHPTSYTDALWATVAGLGDRDTTCAIVGGIVALSAGRESIPAEWLKAREPVQV